MNSEIVRYKRVYKIDLPDKQSAFLWGARKTGKSTFLKEHFPKAVYYDLLHFDLFLKLSRSPHLLRQELLDIDTKGLVIIDEIQKVPALLDEVHWLIENSNYHFILCGSSARKLKRSGVNLLGGRAWDYNFFPLTTKEIKNYTLENIFNRGLIPSHFTSSAYKKSLKSYINNYLKEEIKAEGLVRNLPSFTRFFDSISFCHGEIINFSNIARDCGVDSKTVKEYFQILIDTLVAYFIYPHSSKKGRETLISAPKFYLFDVGVANYLQKKEIKDLIGENAGRALEHFIFMELYAYREIIDKDFEINYWRTKTGLEVDFILNKGSVAIEVKIKKEIHKQDIKGLIAFKEENPKCTCYVVSQDPRPRKMSIENIGDISILPYKEFLDRLWSNKII